MSHSSPLVPTWQGHIASTLDALLLFEAALSGRINHVPRRPHDRERQELIKSGSVFIYEEHASGIKRWTDGVSWSPSRILGNFLIYRELDKPFPPGEKKRAIRRKRVAAGSSAGVTKTESTSRSGNGGFLSHASDNTKDIERSLIGSLVDSYPFKDSGLVKKTISITYHGIPHHLVSYYSVEDVLQGSLVTPSRDNMLRDIVPRVELMTSQNFRAPVDEIEYNPDGTPTLLSVHGSMGEYSGSGSILQRAWSGSMQPMSGPPYSAPQAAPFHFSHSQQSPYGSQLAHAMSHPMASPMPPPLPSSMSLPVPASIPPPSSAGMPFAPHSQGNYALDPNRAERLGGSGSGIGSEFPRNMPTQSAPRRHSAFDAAGSATDLAGLPLGPMGEARAVVGGGGAYMHPPQSQYLLAHRPSSLPNHDNQLYPSSREVKVEASAMGGDDGGTHPYGLDDSGGAWGFESMDGSQDQQFYGGQ
ncbi:Gti1/Pac2 family protein [Purpureocillium lilacinum]|uniref:Gti1/Pac2 family protein n=2 Tax=Purpureocillium lilacinum TaxID=33203 RepID=A0A179HJZ7_PURLI|nr:Gti1/Pac2 family protein [Purpureocillium lilacinum]KAK4082456.1 hypothetical protein Purlil1_11231 [Purpureocillium lilacinum]OAQ83923.1 Gti1/Pac2 family protein [Purpureocillium lilacinum]OAQ90705.1 Gti1/Pac2 family protein [Purpureocillium lilacinum]PWI68554.1 hypothetical protein PCL_01643 [Purpureocillium lilacinum]GJN68258.1 hypothetical protein PLICBS_002301 [Purpureocillium lilacinum]